MGTIASQITSLTIVYTTVYSDADQSKHQSSASLAFVWGIHRRPVNSPHKGPITRKMFPFDDVIMFLENSQYTPHISPVKGRNGMFFQMLINVLPQSLKCYMEYHALLNRVIAASDYIYICRISYRWHMWIQAVVFIVDLCKDTHSFLDNDPTNSKQANRQIYILFDGNNPGIIKGGDIVYNSITMPHISL